MTETVPRVASSLDDLRVGQTVAWKIEDDEWFIDKVESEYVLSKWNFVGTEVILSDPPPEPVTVSREAFDRLAEALTGSRLADREMRYWQFVDVAARALVDEVKGQTDVG